MTPVKEILLILQDWIEDTSFDDSFIRFINYGVRECEKIVNWPALRGTKTITVGSDGILTFPPRCREIVSIFPSTGASIEAYKFNPIDEGFTTDAGRIYQNTYEPYEPISSVLASALITVTQGSATITPTAGSFSETWVGETLMIDESGEQYEITAASESSMTVDHPVVADSGSYTGTVRPVGLERIILKTANRVAFEGDVIVTYQKKHPTLYDDSSMLLIPCFQTVALLALQNALITNKYSVDAQRLDAAVIMAKRSELDSYTYKRRKTARADRLFSVRSNR